MKRNGSATKGGETKEHTHIRTPANRMKANNSKKKKLKRKRGKK